MDKKEKIQESNDSRGAHTLYVVGIGPGGAKHLTGKAREILSGVEVVVGYTTYINLISEIIEGKEIFQTPMRGEVERCREAIALARSGRRVAVVSGGDAGIYAMAGLVFELIADKEGENDSLNVEVVPGVPAFVSAAAVLGAPLMHDFASISLSDLLTPWETITKRIEAAAAADFVIALYNPKSKTRTTHLGEAIDIIRTHRIESTPVGIVRNSSRADEEVTLTILSKLSDHYEKIDMSTILIVGNSTTFITDKKNRNNRQAMITPRGYDTRK